MKEYVSSEEEEESDEQDEDDIERAKQMKKDAQFTVKRTAANEYLIKREATLIAILKRSFKSRVIIFCNEKIQCTRLLALLTMYGFKATECHGNMEQTERLQAVERF